MRIISGKYRGLKLLEFETEGIRPTADRVKESLFNILYGKVAGARVLDLFCGSGNLGIECLSRGADFAHFNDKSPESCALLKKNLAKIKDGNFKITNLDFAACLNMLSGNEKFDLIFLDPPYKTEAGRGALEIIAKRGLLAEKGIAVYERDRNFDGEVAGLEKFDERKYGKTFITFFRVVKQ
ncbi:MAG: 16S rRNA (guanine(966)-N(2))-methyltransferase RsmD [Clostridia bacterium]|nr:16S rRNA (guanine(966)-N(2))-methyltransferase RsmD [Clostridia bacterium]